MKQKPLNEKEVYLNPTDEPVFMKEDVVEALRNLKEELRKHSIIVDEIIDKIMGEFK